MPRRFYKDENRAFSETFSWQAQMLLNTLGTVVVRALPASEEDDRYKATDFTFEIESKRTIGFRVRRGLCPYRDFTIRYRVPGGYKTEYDKLCDGYADFYLYAWADRTETSLCDWMFIDMSAVRAACLLRHVSWPVVNHDGTEFVSIELDKLFHHRCIVRSTLDRLRPVTQNELIEEWEQHENIHCK